MRYVDNNAWSPVFAENAIDWVPFCLRVYCRLIENLIVSEKRTRDQFDREGVGEKNVFRYRVLLYELGDKVIFALVWWNFLRLVKECVLCECAMMFIWKCFYVILWLWNVNVRKKIVCIFDPIQPNTSIETNGIAEKKT